MKARNLRQVLQIRSVSTNVGNPADQKHVQAILDSLDDNKPLRDLRAVDKGSLESVLGVPEAHLLRTVIISKQNKSSTQQGWANSHGYELSFSRAQQWVNPLMGWTSSRDPLNHIRITFDTLEDAQHWAQLNGFQYIVDKDQTTPLDLNPRNYTSKFKYVPPKKGLDAISNE